MRVRNIVLCIVLLPGLSCAAAQRDATAEGAGDAAHRADGDPGVSDSPPAATPVRPGLCRPTFREGGFMPEGAGEAPAGPGQRSASILRVSISVGPPGGGRAYRDVERDGRVSGGHLSGDPGAPMVTVEHGRVSAGCVGAVWEAASRLHEALLRADAAPPLPDAETTTLGLTLEGDVVVEARWPFGEEPSLAEARALAALLGEMEIGHW